MARRLLHAVLLNPKAPSPAAARLLRKRQRLDAAPLSTTSMSGKTSFLLRPDEDGPPPPRPLYEGHVPTTPLQKAFVAAYAAFTAIANPERGDMVAALGEVTGVKALRRLRDGMRGDPVGREILKERPVITEKDVGLERLRGLPEGSFGREYARYMDSHEFSPDERSPVRFVDDEELAYVILRYRQVHDFWHVLTGLPPTVMGELALKWFELAQTGLPLCAFSGVFAPLILKAEDQRLLREVYLPWAMRAARQAKPLLNVWYERVLDVPVADLRKSLNFEPAPPLPVSSAGTAKTKA